jgi:hypothetical protein
MSDSEVYQDDHVPEGARPNRWQSLHIVLQVRYHHKPVYSLQRHLDVWHVGASAKMRFTVSVWYRFRDGGVFRLQREKLQG